MTSPILNRRDAVATLLAFSAAGSLAACGNAANEASGDVDLLRYASATSFFSETEMSQIAAIADTIIPTTNTPGAVAAGVPDVIQGLASVWGDDGFRQFSRAGLASLIGALDERAGETFVSLPAAAKLAALKTYDAGVYGGGVEDEFYKAFKNTVATAYYMSEPGFQGHGLLMHP
jgi:hypothetical protein